MSKCLCCKEKEREIGRFCVECRDKKDHFCKCGEPKFPHNSYCRTCSTKRTTSSGLKTGRIVIKENGAQKRRLPKKLVDEKMFNDLELFINYIKEKNSIDFWDINTLIDLYEGFYEVLKEKGKGKGRSININIEDMWKYLYQIYKLDF